MLDRLFSPLRIGSVELQNRIVSTAHQTTLVHEHLPTEDFVAYHEARARGGTGLIVLEATAVHPSGLLTSHTLAGYREEIVPGLARVAEAVHGHGTRLFVQLFHGGREQISSPPREPALAPSAIPSLRFHVEPRALSAEEIDSIVDGYARVAALAAKAGLDGVEISAAHEYLAAQFFTPALNRRDDKWSEPARFLLAVLGAVRAAAPGLAVGVRLSADSGAAAAVCGEVAPSVDYVSVALGASSTYRGSAGIVPPPPLPENAIAALTAPFRAGPPLVATSRIVDPVEADRLVADGRCDAAGMTRALITDPDLPRKAREGRLDDVLRCIGCNACIAHYHAGTPIACAQNPRTGRERTMGPAAALQPGAGSWSSAEARPASLQLPRRGRPDTRSSSSSAATKSAGRSRWPGRRRCTPSSRVRWRATTGTCSRPRTSRPVSRPRRISRPSPRWRRMRSSSPPALARTSQIFRTAGSRSSRRWTCSAVHRRAAGASSSPTGEETRRAWPALTSSRLLATT